MPLPRITARGNLGADPELKYTNSGTPVARLRVACNKPQRGDDGSWSDGETCWLTVTAWKRAAERATEHLTKGDTVVVTGELRQRDYTDNDGNKRTVFEVATFDDLAKVPRDKTQRSNGQADDAWSTPADTPPF